MEKLKAKKVEQPVYDRAERPPFGMGRSSMRMSSFPYKTAVFMSL